MHTYPMQETGTLKKRLSFTENIQLLLCEWESREQIQPVELVFQQLYLSLEVSFSFSSFFGYGAVFGGWGISTLCQLLHALLLGTS